MRRLRARDSQTQLSNVGAVAENARQRPDCFLPAPRASTAFCAARDFGKLAYVFDLRRWPANFWRSMPNCANSRIVRKDRQVWTRRRPVSVTP